MRLQQGCQEIQGRLIEGAEGAPSVLEHLGACDQELSAMAGLDPALQPIRQSWIDAQTALEDLGRDLDRYAAALEADPEHLAALQERIAALKALERRFGADLEALIERRDQLRDTLQAGGAAAALVALEQEELLRRQQRDAACQKLTDQRQKQRNAWSMT